MFRRTISALGATFVVLAAGIAGCDCGGNGNGGDLGPDSSNDLSNDGANDGLSDLPPGDLFVPDGPGVMLDGGFCYYASCGRPVWACGDCMDNDGDGLIDDQDPDCLGPCHNSEDMFYLNVPGSETANCGRDCYYDGNQGSGNDGCQWGSDCDPLAPEIGCPHDPSPNKCPDPQDAECADTCPRLTPNGCDCFGCCYIEFESMSATVFLGTRNSSNDPTCSLDNPAGCNPCTQNDDCVNECGRCELCLGRDPSEIPLDCFDMGVRTCPFNLPVCGLPGDAPCPDGSRCVTGCCYTVIF